MTATFEQASDAILTLFKDAWDTTGYPVVWDNSAAEKPSTTTPWARAVVRHEEGEQASLSGANGLVRWRRRGLFFCQIFVPVGEGGLSAAYPLAKIVVDAFEGVSTPGTQVWFRNVRMKEIGPDGEWFQVNVMAEFEYDEIK